MEGSVEGAALDYPVDSWPLDSPSKSQHIAGFGSNNEMLFVDGAFDAA
jgi:hypothetical protein